MSRPPRRHAAAVLTLAVALAACGSGSSTDRAAGSTAESEPATPTESTETGTSTARARPAQARRGIRLVQIGSFSSPLHVTAPPGDRRRVFVVEQGGRIMVVRGGRKLARPFLDISSLVQAGGEQGLLSMAFAPDYASSGRFYVYYTDREAQQRIVEYRRSSRRPRERGQRAAGAADGGPRAQPQRRADGLRARRAHVRGHRRRRRRQRPARLARQRAVAVLAAGQDPAHRSAGRGRPALPDPELEPVRGALGRARRDLRLRPAQPVALLVRPGHRRPEHRRRRPGRGRGGQLRARRDAGRTSAGGRSRATAGSSTSPRPARSRRSSRTRTRRASARSPVATWCAIPRCRAWPAATSTPTSARAGSARRACARGRRTRGRVLSLPGVASPSSFGEDARGRVYVTSLAGPVYRFAAPR